MRVLLAAALSLSLVGCLPYGDCDPEPDISVQLEPLSEDVRSLPILASGKTSLLGIDVPDSHGDVRVKATLTNASSVDIVSVAYEQTVDGAVKDIRLVSQQQNDHDVANGAALLQSATLKWQWRMKSLAAYVLPSAKPHSGKVTLNWRHRGCRVQEGVATLDVPGTVKAAASATNLSLDSAEAFAPDATKGGKVKLAVRSAVGDGLVNLSNAKISVTYFSEGLAPTIGLALLSSDQLALQSGGTSRSAISATEVLDVYSSKTPTVNAAPYEYAGTAANVSLGTGAKALVTLTLSSSKASQTTTTQVDSLSALVDVK